MATENFFISHSKSAENGRHLLRDVHAKTLAQRAEKDRVHEQIKQILLYINQRHLEEGQENHVIKLDELAQALGITKDETKQLIRRGFSATGLNEILEAMELPHEKKSKF